MGWITEVQANTILIPKNPRKRPKRIFVAMETFWFSLWKSETQRKQMKHNRNIKQNQIFMFKHLSYLVNKTLNEGCYNGYESVERKNNVVDLYGIHAVGIPVVKILLYGFHGVQTDVECRIKKKSQTV